MEELWIYYTRQRSRARKVICKTCKKELLVSKNKTHCGYCQSCNARRVNPRVKDTETFIQNKSGSRSRARKILCKSCSAIIIVRKDKSHCGLCQRCNAARQGRNCETNGSTLYRKKARGHWPEICFSCLENKKEIIIHHIDGDRSNNKIENLLMLCRSCHVAIHWRIRKGFSTIDAFEDVKEKKRLFPGLWERGIKNIQKRAP